MGDINNQNNDIAAIRKVLGLEESKCRITHPNSFYVIQPIDESERLHIAHITDFNIFNRYNLSFKNCVFECEFRFTIKSSTIKFDRCIFKKFVNFNPNHFNTSFNGDFICQDTIFKDIVYFINLNFKGDVDFSRSLFKKRVFFSESIFEQNASFEEVIFEHNAYFDETTFNGNANFKQSEFYVNVHFYQTKFKNDREKSEREEPNFKQAIFNGYINLTDTKIFDFNFEQLKLEARTSSGAKDFRNIFKNIKNALIKDSNLIDASHFHKMELYAKELEISYKQEKSAKDWVEQIQLYCYRLTSDHHTNLLLILNHIIFLITLFYVANLGLTLCATDFNFENIEKISNTKIREIYIVSLFVGLAVCFIFDCFNKITSTIICICMPITCICFFPCFVYFLNVERCFTVLYCVALLLLACACILRYRNKQYAFLCPYPIVLVMLFTTPSSILPILGKLIENKSTEACFLVIGKVKILCWSGASSTPETLNLIYMLFLFLLLWSLQKTARKNTIVPS